ncbi:MULTISPECIES: hypothetical protein [unclassified Sporosarcina]|uniref:hypothetical protein n=1 Tax=unclassified Sporosarcina TaxID=2647733 RepID=UPI001A92C253|nr:MULTISPECIES: hypothetical protein [unclassified Sporosarcina]MBO0588168.1 hypothetical protein [Sporosarcina sp. E16_8]MBO0601922.1 hypothetical protein [Sporosarcina sp. E16_3]
MNIGTFELWQTDKALMEYMLDRCIVAKMIESTSNPVPDNYSFYYEGGMDGIGDYSYLETVQDFLSLSKIGKLKFRNLDMGDYAGAVSIQLFALEELTNCQLTLSQRNIIADWMREFANGIELMDLSNLEGKCNAVGTSLILRLYYVVGFASEFCQKLLSIHEDAQKMIRSIRRNPKGEITNANTSQV